MSASVVGSLHRARTAGPRARARARARAKAGVRARAKAGGAEAVWAEVWVVREAKVQAAAKVRVKGEEEAEVKAEVEAGAGSLVERRRYVLWCPSPCARSSCRTARAHEDMYLVRVLDPPGRKTPDMR